MNELVTKAIKDINNIKDSMLKSGNDIARIIYRIRDELKERNACRDFGLAVGMSKASISKMVTAETYRAKLNIKSEVSYNTIYKVKDLFGIDDNTTITVVKMLNSLKSENEIRNLLCKSEDTAEDTAEDTEETRLEIINQIFSILDTYDIAKDDMKLIKMLIKGLR